MYVCRWRREGGWWGWGLGTGPPRWSASPPRSSPAPRSDFNTLLAASVMLVCAKCDLAQAERVTALDMLERETRRERVLENRAKALRVADK